MLLILLFWLIILFIPNILMIMNFFFSKKKNHNYEKMSPFECGFDPLSKSRLPFSIQFFLISLIFLIFDIEIALLIPLILLIKKFSLNLIFTSMFFLLILLAGLLYEYTEKSLEWKI